MVCLTLLSLALVGSLAVLTPWGSTSDSEQAGRLLEHYFTPAQIQRSDDFHDAAKWPSWLRLLMDIVLAVVVGFSPIGRRLVDLVRARQRRWWVQVVALVALVSVVVRLLTLPVSAWGHRVASDYGLATQTWAEWMVDVLKSLGITVMLGSLALLALVGLARRFRRRWFVPAACLAAAAAVAVSFAYPLVFEPVFNNFTALPDTRLKQQLLDLADRDQIEVSEVLEADASRRTTALNAYVSGIGATKRIVVYDTLVASAPDREVALVVAHELGHADANDVLVGTAQAALGSALAVVALFVVLSLERLRRPLRAGSAADPAVVPIILALSVLAGFAAAPVVNTVSRQVEGRADLHSLELTQEPDTFIALHRRLAVTNLSHLDPNPLLALWFNSHPMTLDRLAAAEAWRAAHASDSPSE
ncbi:MAG: M48 family metalloprotease [Nocardioidaceae bacterium]|nr:M48 family metalloprotease [Nocardioidaceae bacterium]